MTTCILAGGYSVRAADGGRAFVEALAAGHGRPVKSLECIFARPESEWAKAYEDDQALFAQFAPGTFEARIATLEV